MVVFSPATIDILQTPSKFSLRKMVPASARSHFKNCQPAQVRPAERIFCRADPLGTPDDFLHVHVAVFVWNKVIFIKLYTNLSILVSMEKNINFAEYTGRRPVHPREGETPIKIIEVITGNFEKDP